MFNDNWILFKHNFRWEKQILFLWSMNPCLANTCFWSWNNKNYILCNCRVPPPPPLLKIKGKNLYKWLFFWQESHPFELLVFSSFRFITFLIIFLLKKIITYVYMCKTHTNCNPMYKLSKRHYVNNEYHIKNVLILYISKLTFLYFLVN